MINPKSNILNEYKLFIFGEPSSTDTSHTTPQGVLFCLISCKSRLKGVGVQEGNQHIYSDKEERHRCRRSDVDWTPYKPVRVPQSCWMNEKQVAALVWQVWISQIMNGVIMRTHHVTQQKKQWHNTLFKKCIRDTSWYVFNKLKWQSLTCTPHSTSALLYLASQCCIY